MKKPTNILPAIVKVLPTIIKMAHELTIEKAEDMPVAVEVLSLLNAKSDALEEDRKSIVKPIKDSIKKIEAKYKEPQTMLEEAIDFVRGKMTAYQTEQVRLQKEAADKIAEDLSLNKLSIETAVEKIESLDSPESKVETTSGSVTFIEVEDFEVEDKTRLSFDYLLPDLVKIRASMKEGVHINGVRYFKEMKPRNNR